MAFKLYIDFVIFVDVAARITVPFSWRVMNLHLNRGAMANLSFSTIVFQVNSIQHLKSYYYRSWTIVII